MDHVAVCDFLERTTVLLLLRCGVSRANGSCRPTDAAAVLATGILFFNCPVRFLRIRCERRPPRHGCLDFSFSCCRQPEVAEMGLVVNGDRSTSIARHSSGTAFCCSVRMESTTLRCWVAYFFSHCC